MVSLSAEEAGFIKSTASFVCGSGHSGTLLAQPMAMSGKRSHAKKNHQADQKQGAWRAGRHDGEERSAENHTERVGADDVAGLGDRDAQLARHFWEQAHGHELARADR